MSASNPKNPIVVLEVDNRETFHLTINYQNAPSLDYVLNMLAQAARTIEFQQRIGMEQQIAQKMMQAQAEESIRQSLVSGRKQ